ncbi:TPA_asm: protein 4 [Streptoglossa virus 1]|uniref:Protein 4 n=1 Tax=Streptoglossa virus 1 TaxID=2977992 RepID=A0A9N6YJG5_9RHAB|nr:TPA_asm: protein 4 [Streptoglossa virus 1]
MSVNPYHEIITSSQRRFRKLGPNEKPSLSQLHSHLMYEIKARENIIGNDWLHSELYSYHIIEDAIQERVTKVEGVCSECNIKADKYDGIVSTNQIASIYCELGHTDPFEKGRISYIPDDIIFCKSCMVSMVLQNEPAMSIRFAIINAINKHKSLNSDALNKV